MLDREMLYEALHKEIPILTTQSLQIGERGTAQGADI